VPTVPMSTWTRIGTCSVVLCALLAFAASNGAVVNADDHGKCIVDGPF